MGRTPTAEILLPKGGDPWQWYHSCYALAEANRWPVRGVVYDWQDLVRILTPRCPQCGFGGGADIGIVPIRSMLAPDRLPRLVVVAEEPQPAKLLPQQRRPIRLR